MQVTEGELEEFVEEVGFSKLVVNKFGRDSVRAELQGQHTVSFPIESKLGKLQRKMDPS